MKMGFLADELREITASLDDTALMGQPIHRRLLALTHAVEKLDEETVETTTTTETRELDVMVSGLEPDQELRTRALEIAVAWVGRHWVGGTRDRTGILAVADECAAYIRDGSKP